MTIAYVGNFTQPHCTEVHLAATLEDLGHAVMRLQEDAYTPTELANILDQAKLDLFLYTRTWGKTVTLEHLELLRQRKIPSASYHLDLYIGLSRKWLHEGKPLDQVLETDPFWRTDFVFTPDGDPESQEVFERHGVKHHYMKPGVFASECYIPTLAESKYDVIFVGGGDRVGSPNGYGHPEWPYRDQLMTWLYDTYGERFKKFGHPQPTIRNDTLNQLYTNTKVVVGDSVCLDFKHTYYWSDRVYETLGRGGFLIHPYIKGLEEEFTDRETIVFYEYNNWGQLKELIDYYLKDDSAREKIRLAGHELVKNNYTYRHRLKQMFVIIGSAGVWPTLAPAHSSPIRLNLGAGKEPEEGFVNVDIVELEGIQVVHNLMHFPYPFGDGTADYIKAKDLVEHLAVNTPDGKSTIIAFIEECHRILQTGGTLWIQTPAWDADFLWIDPTHVRGFDIRSFDFFDPETDFGRATGFYSKSKFKVSANRLENGNLQFEMVKL